MYAEPMGSKTPNSRSPQSGMRMDHHTLSDDGEEVLQPSPPVPGTSPPPPRPHLEADKSNAVTFLWLFFLLVDEHQSNFCLQACLSTASLFDQQTSCAILQQPCASI